MTMDDNCFSLLHVNIRSLQKNFENLKLLLKSIKHKFSVIALSETWLKTIPHCYYSLPGYELIVNNRHGPKTGGGVALYISDELNVIIREDLNFSDDSLEFLFVEISKPKAKNIIAGVVYKAPSIAHDEFMTTFQNICSSISCNTPCVISGDFNINLLNYSNYCSQSFMDLLTTNTFLPLIDKPTRITDTSATLIDNLFCNILPCPKSGILLSDISDHLPIFMYIQSPNSNVPNSSTSSHNNNHSNRNFSQSNLQKFNEDLFASNWADVFCCNDPEESFNVFINKFNYLYDKDIPPKSHNHKPSRKHSPNLPWITCSLLRSINKKNKLYRQYMSNPTIPHKNKYTKYKNTLTSLLRTSKENYYANQFEKAQKSVQNTWKQINSILNKNKSSKTIKTIISDGHLTSSPDEIADCFNSYFSNIGPDLASKIQQTNTSLSFTDTLTNPSKNSLFFTPVNKYEVTDIVNNLENKNIL